MSILLDDLRGVAVQGWPVCEGAANEIEQLESELTDLRARCEKAETIADAARNLIAQKGRHNTEIAYKRVEDIIAKDRT